jgi:hypothetical protein
MSNYSSIDEIVLETREVAEEVIFNINKVMDTYGSVAVADVYDICGLVSDYKAGAYGWTDVSSAKVETCKNGYMIKIDSPTKFK